MIRSVFLRWTAPRRFVARSNKERPARIAARLLAERHSDMAFGFEAGPDVRHGDCHPSPRDTALAIEGRRLIPPEPALGAVRNPENLLKQCALGIQCAETAQD